MIRTSFNIDWTFGPKQNEFAELGNTNTKVPVRLPHDAVIATQRDPAAPSGAPTGFFQGGVWEYIKRFDAPVEWRDKTVLLDFEGVYRSATIFLNGARIAEHANGYTSFAVNLDTHLRYGAENTLTVEARAHLDSRCYTGGGIYRPVHLIVAEPVHITLDGVTVRTPEVTADEALIEIDAVLANATRNLAETTLETVIVDPQGKPVLTDTSPVSVLPQEDAILHQRLLLPNPNLWSLDAPNIYTVRTTLIRDGVVIDESEETFGIRKLQVDVRHGLRVNGNRFFYAARASTTTTASSVRPPSDAPRNDAWSF